MNRLKVTSETVKLFIDQRYFYVKPVSKSVHYAAYQHLPDLGLQDQGLPDLGLPDLGLPDLGLPALGATCQHLPHPLFPSLRSNIFIYRTNATSTCFKPTTVYSQLQFNSQVVVLGSHTSKTGSGSSQPRQCNVTSTHLQTYGSGLPTVLATCSPLRRHPTVIWKSNLYQIRCYHRNSGDDGRDEGDEKRNTEVNGIVVHIPDPWNWMKNAWYTYFIKKLIDPSFNMDEFTIGAKQVSFLMSLLLGPNRLVL